MKLNFTCKFEYNRENQMVTFLHLCNCNLIQNFVQPRKLLSHSSVGSFITPVPVLPCQFGDTILGNNKNMV
jgi:hypothetical protein